MRSSDNCSSILRVVKRDLVSVTFPSSLLFSNGKVLGRGCAQRFSLTLRVPKGGALHYETKSMSAERATSILHLCYGVFTDCFF